MFSIAEQTVQTQAFAGEDSPKLTTFTFGSDNNAAHVATMTLGCADGSSYVVEFSTNGVYQTSRKVEAPKPPEETPPPSEDAHASASSHSRSRSR